VRGAENGALEKEEEPLLHLLVGLAFEGGHIWPDFEVDEVHDVGGLRLVIHNRFSGKPGLKSQKPGLNWDIDRAAEFRQVRLGEGSACNRPRPSWCLVCLD